jgi:riboflavin biosynthesis pyrimidine reductase
MTIDEQLKRALTNASLQTVDAVLSIISTVKADNADRKNDYQVGADDALGEVIGRLHIFKLKLNGDKE